MMAAKDVDIHAIRVESHFLFTTRSIYLIVSRRFIHVNGVVASFFLSPSVLLFFTTIGIEMKKSSHICCMPVSIFFSFSTSISTIVVCNNLFKLNVIFPANPFDFVIQIWYIRLGWVLTFVCICTALVWFLICINIELFPRQRNDFYW